MDLNELFVLAVAYGCISIVLAIMAQNMGAIFPATMKAVGATAGPLGGIFVIGLFLPMVDKKVQVFIKMKYITGII